MQQAAQPKQLGRYTLIRELGAGAMGIVYEGKDPILDRRVAIKTVHLSALKGNNLVEYQRRFSNEAKSAARVQHPNIAAVYDFGEQDGIDYIVMEFVDGIDLKHRLAEGGLTLKEAIKLIQDLLMALGFLHVRDVVHRDVKPANLIIEHGTGQVKVTDFGVAKLGIGDGDATRTGLVGTPHYMSPEQIECRLLDGRSDLFSAGVIFYQLVSGKLPFEAENPFAVMKKIIAEDPPDLQEPTHLMREMLMPILDRALAKQADQRFQTANDFSLALDQLSAALESSDAGATLLLTEAPKDSSLAFAQGHGHGSTRGGRRRTPFGATAAAPFGTGSGIQVELELRLWEEIRAAGDQDDFEEFLRRFPEGAFSTLARKRLSRAQGDGSLGDMSGATTASGLTVQAALTAAGQPGNFSSASVRSLQVTGFDNDAALRDWQKLNYRTPLLQRRRLESEVEKNLIAQAVAAGLSADEAAINAHSRSSLDLALDLMFSDVGEVKFDVLDQSTTQPSMLINDNGHHIIEGSISHSGHSSGFRQLVQAMGIDRLVATRISSQLLSANFELIRTSWQALRSDALVFEYAVSFIWQLGADGWRICITAATDFYSSQRQALLATQSVNQRPQLDAAFLDQMTLAFHHEYQAGLFSGNRMVREPMFTRPFMLSSPSRTVVVPVLTLGVLPYANLKGVQTVAFRWHLAADWLRVLQVDYQIKPSDEQPNPPILSIAYLLKVGADGARILALLALQDEDVSAEAVTTKG